MAHVANLCCCPWFSRLGLLWNKFSPACCGILRHVPRSFCVGSHSASGMGDIQNAAPFVGLGRAVIIAGGGWGPSPSCST